MDKDIERKGGDVLHFMSNFARELIESRPGHVTRSEASDEIWNLYVEMFPKFEVISSEEWEKFNEELKRRFQIIFDFKTGKFDFYAFMHIDTGQKTEKTPNLEWYDWNFSFYYIPEEDENDLNGNENDLLKDIPDELALHYRAIRRDRLCMCEFF